MNVVAEKMREMRSRLKSAGERLREYSRFPNEPATFLRQKAQIWRARARQWRNVPDAVPADEPAPPPSPGQRFWPSPAPDARDASQPLQPETRAGTESWQARHRGIANGLRFAGMALAVFLALPYFLAPFYRFIDPPFSALMARQWIAGVDVRRDWVSFDAISPALPLAVVISEDAGFCRHWGVDWRAVGAAIDDAEDGDKVRGASTIPMQTAKNLFLWNGYSFIRKILEIPLAYYLSALWPKERVLEVYLNIAEWGPGIFGAEAAARYHFGKSAAQLTGREAALLAASLPNPIIRRAGRPSGRTATLAARIQARAGREAHDASCVLSRGR